MPVEDTVAKIRAALERELQPARLTIEDESAAHAGHAGAREGGHFRLHVVSDRFRGLSRLARHRIVYEAVAALMSRGVHALAIDARVALSLDFRGGTFAGPEDLHDRPALWPRRVIVMTLDRVGSGRGPDFRRLATIKVAAADARSIYAAGGVRDADDLARLAAMGIAGALVASCLHDGRVTAGDIAALA